MAIKGSLAEASLPDVIQLLSMGNKTGVLSVTDRQNFGNIYFKDGKIVYANIVNRADRIGDLLLKEGVITQEDLNKALEIQKKNKDDKKLGTILVEMGVVTLETVKKYLTAQVESAVYNLLTWNNGYFSFEPNRLPEEENMTLSLTTHNLVLEGARRIDEWRLIRRMLTSFDLIVEITPSTDKEKQPETTDEFGLENEDWKILSLINGNRTIQDIINITEMDEFDVSKSIYKMISKGLVRISKGKKEEVSASPAQLSRIQEHLNLGIAFLKAKMYDDSAREYEKVLKINPGHAEARFYLGLIAILSKNYQKAIDEYKELLKSHSYNTKIYNNLGVALENTNDPSVAELYQKALSLDEKNQTLHSNLGIYYYKKGEYSKAIQELEKSLEMNKNNGLASYFYLGLALTREGLYDKAILIYQKALEKNFDKITKREKFHCNLGVVYEQKGTLDEAKKEYELAIKDDPELVQAHKNLGDILYKESWFDKAKIEYEKVISLRDEYSDVHFKLGNILLKQGDKASAIKEWKKSLELNPNNEVLKNNLSLIGG